MKGVDARRDYEIVQTLERNEKLVSALSAAREQMAALVQIAGYEVQGDVGAIDELLGDGRAVATDRPTAARP